MPVEERKKRDAFYRARMVEKRAMLSPHEIAEKRARHAAYCRAREAAFTEEQRQQRRDSQTKWMAAKRANNREAFREAERAWKKKKLAESPEFRLTTILRKRLSKAVVRYGMKESKPSALLLVGCTRKELRLHLEKQFKPGMNWGNYGFRGWHVDHIQAIRRNDSDESIERMNKIRTIPLVRGQNSIENYNPACRQCNIWKSTYNIEQFRKEVAEQIKRLNDYNANYRNAKRYGLIVETNIEVKFHFETVCSNDC